MVNYVWNAEYWFPHFGGFNCRIPSHVTFKQPKRGGYALVT